MVLFLKQAWPPVYTPFIFPVILSVIGRRHATNKLPKTEPSFCKREWRAAQVVRARRVVSNRLEANTTTRYITRPAQMQREILSPVDSGVGFGCVTE